MRLLISFFLALISYIAILFILYFLFPKTSVVKPKEVLIHTAIVKPIVKENKPKKIAPKKNVKKVVVEKKETKKVVSKTKSKSAVTKSGDVAINDIFKNVKANVPTTPTHLKKQLLMSRFKGDNILKNISHIKTLNIKISYETTKKSSNVKKSEIDEFVNKIYKIWDNISNIAGEYAIIKIIVNNSQISATILDSNLNENEQQMLVNEINNLKFNKNIELTVKFQTKVNK